MLSLISLSAAKSEGRTCGWIKSKDGVVRNKSDVDLAGLRCEVRLVVVLARELASDCDGESEGMFVEPVFRPRRWGLPVLVRDGS